MIRSRWVYTSCLSAGLLLTLPFLVFGADADKPVRMVSSDSMHCAKLDIHALRCTFYNNGLIGDLSGPGDGFFPAGDAPSALFYTAGPQIIGTLEGDLRSAAVMYSTEFQPGIILPDGSPDDSSNPLYRVHKFNRGDTVPSEVAALGCPSIVLGDQMLFAVFNDLGSHAAVFTKAPVGIEVQMTVWGFAPPRGVLEETVFVRYRIINKNAAYRSLEDAYVGLFSDPDIGLSGDDCAGCDPALDLVYAYNANNDPVAYTSVGDLFAASKIDTLFADHPALGVALLQGPLVEAPGETAMLPGGVLMPDTRMLKLAGWGLRLSGGSIGIGHPVDWLSASYFMMQGLRFNSEAYIDPTTGEETAFPFSGDPVLRTGWIFNHFSPGIEIILHQGSGPLTLYPHAPVDFVFALAAAQGNTHLQSVQHLKRAVRRVKTFYSFGWGMGPGGPAAPVVVAESRDKVVRLSWDAAASTYSDRYGYRFEGYNVWMAEQEAGPWQCIAVYDSVNGVQQIWDDVERPSGDLVYSPVQRGLDTGVQFTHTVSHNPFTGQALVNWRDYVFSVTAYAVHEADWASPRTLETYRNPVKAMPSTLQSGLEAVTAFPNPCFGSLNGVTLAGLPPEPCIIRIFTVAGHNVRVLKHNGHTSTCHWNLLNEASRPVASGMYIVHVEAAVESRVIKLGVVSGQRL